MTREEIFSMPAGPEMDAAIAREVFGAIIIGDFGAIIIGVPPYSTSDAAALEVAKEFSEIHLSRQHFSDWECSLGVDHAAEGYGVTPTGGYEVTARGETSLALAICRAALLASL